MNNPQVELPTVNIKNILAIIYRHKYKFAVMTALIWLTSSYFSISNLRNCRLTVDYQIGELLWLGSPPLTPVKIEDAKNVSTRLLSKHRQSVTSSFQLVDVSIDLRANSLKLIARGNFCTETEAELAGIVNTLQTKHQELFNLAKAENERVINEKAQEISILEKAYTDIIKRMGNSQSENAFLLIEKSRLLSTLIEAKREFEVMKTLILQNPNVPSQIKSQRNMSRPPLYIAIAIFFLLILSAFISGVLIIFVKTFKSQIDEAKDALQN